MDITLGVVVFLGAIIWLLSVPFELRLKYDNQAGGKPEVNLRWLYGLVRVSPEDMQGKRAKPKKKKTDAAGKKRDKSGFKIGLAVMRSQGMVARIQRFIMDCFRSFKVRDSRFMLRFGLGDPAETGEVLGLMAPLFLWMQYNVLPTSRLIPDFDQRIFHINIQTSITTSPLKFIWLGLGLLFSPVIWRGIRAASKAKTS